MVIGLALAGPASAQDTGSKLALTPEWAADRYLPNRSSIELRLDRPLRAPTERLAIVIGTVDVSALIEIRGDRVRYRPVGTRLPAGQTDVVAYLVTDGGWEEVGRFPLKVRSRIGLDRGRIVPSIDLTSAGQLDQGGSDPSGSNRGAFQDLTIRIGLQSEWSQGPWQVTTLGNVLGASDPEQRLRWNDLETDAPAVDLADYRIGLAGPGTRVSVGNLSAGGHRYLLENFASRGADVSLALGKVVSVEAALLHGTNVVGWDNLLGLGRSAHRIGTATLGLDLIPARPGGIRLEVSGLDGSILPRTSVNQGAATDAEESRGIGSQVTVSDAKERIKFSGGIARSRFANPADPLLAPDPTVVPVRPATRTARHAELDLQLLRGHRLSGSLEAGLSTTIRHERVDPLFRSVGASPQADLERNALEATGSLGPLAIQVGLARARDNLAGLRSILTSRTRNGSASASLPTGALVRRRYRWYFPVAGYAWQRTRQFGDGVPENGDFSATHVPDQVSTNQTATLVWTRESTSLSYRWNRSFQDNRQIGRDRSDFRTTVNTIALSATPHRRLTATLDAGLERQKAFETSTVQRLERIGGSIRWQARRATELSGLVSQSWAVDPAADRRARNTELQFELSQGIDLYRRPEDGTQGRLFVRFSRTRVAVRSLAPTDLLAPTIRWTLEAGGSVRLY